jgi:ABC-type transport system involved in cytochrome c biogenesis ATPase subunit
MKPVFAEAIEHCKTLKAEARAEEELALKDSVEKPVKVNEAVSIAPTMKIEETKEEPVTELSEPKKAQLLKEAVLARDQLRAVMDEVEAHLKVLQPSDKVEIVGGEVVVHPA